MSYYCFNRKELLKKAKEKHENKGGIKKVAEYYEDNKEVIKGKARKKYRNLTEEEKELRK